MRILTNLQSIKLAFATASEAKTFIVFASHGISYFTSTIASAMASSHCHK